MNHVIRVSPLNILLVEDNIADADLTIEALKDSRINIQIDVVDDGEKALNYLLQKGEYKTALTPDIIFLDLNLPRINGNEVLKEIRNNDRLKHLTVVVLSTSDSPDDISNIYQLNANCYIKKPVDVDLFYEAIASLMSFWCTHVKLPINSHQNLTPVFGQHQILPTRH